MNSSIRCVVLLMAMICKMDHVAGQFVAFLSLWKWSSMQKMLAKTIVCYESGWCHDRIYALSPVDFWM